MKRGLDRWLGFFVVILSLSLCGFLFQPSQILGQEDTTSNTNNTTPKGPFKQKFPRKTPTPRETPPPRPTPPTPRPTPPPRSTPPPKPTPPPQVTPRPTPRLTPLPKSTPRPIPSPTPHVYPAPSAQPQPVPETVPFTLYTQPSIPYQQNPKAVTSPEVGMNPKEEFVLEPTPTPLPPLPIMVTGAENTSSPPVISKPLVIDRTPDTFFPLISGSSVSYTLGDSTQIEPIFGYLGFNSVPPTLPIPGWQLIMRDISLDIPAPLPFGIIHLQLRSPTPLVQKKDVQAALGTTLLRIYLPLHKTSYDIIGNSKMYGTRYPYQYLNIDFSFNPKLPNFDQRYDFHITAKFDRPPIKLNDVLAVIRDMNDPDTDVREVANDEIIRVGRAALNPLEITLQHPLSSSHKTMLDSAIDEISGVTLKSQRWIGTNHGSYIFEYDVTAPDNGEEWSHNIYGIHFIVGKPENSLLDFTKYKFSAFLPQEWKEQYKPEEGELVFSSTNNPLLPAVAYKIKIRTESLYRQTPGFMGWYWTNKLENKIGDAHFIPGPVFILQPNKK